MMKIIIWSFILIQVKTSSLVYGKNAVHDLNEITQHFSVKSENQKFPKVSSCSIWKGTSILRRELCRGASYSNYYLEQGYKTGVYYCGKKMEHERWNCSLGFGRKEKVHSYSDGELPYGLQGTKEAAFYYALTRAAMAFSIANACLNDNTLDCSCSSNIPNEKEIPESFPDGHILLNSTLSDDYEIRWSYCSSANVEYGISESIRGLGENRILSKRRKLSQFDRVNIMNANVGRAIYYQMSTLVCHCHGYSGTCSQLSCWRRHPNVNDMATVLKKKISEARYVKRSRLNKLIKEFKMNRRRPASARLLFIKKTPDLCTRNESLGIRGVGGRESSSSNIETFCCNNGYHNSYRVHNNQCNCKFSWCCHVECEVCSKVKQNLVCNG